MKNKQICYIIIVAILTLAILGTYIYYINNRYIQVSENQYNQSFYELLNNVQNVETYLAKSLISTSPQHGAETLTNVWREANLAQAYLSELPVSGNELKNTEKFLNQVSDYSYSLSRKNIYNQELTQEDLDNLKQLYDYSIELENTLNQLATDMETGNISWKELTKKTKNVFAQEVSNISQESFSNIDSNFHEYSGLIYDGAFSEHLESVEKKGLTGNDIEEENAKQIAEDFIGKEKIKETNSNGFSENGEIQTYDFIVTLNDNNHMIISISKKGGHIVYMNSDRAVTEEKISQEDASGKAKEFLETREFKSMKETYYLKQEGILTINFAYNQDDVVIYPDLIKVKVALDNGEIMGIETSGYLNMHTVRMINEPKIKKEDAKEKLNRKLDIKSENLAIIPTKFKTEILCWEFKGKVEDRDYIVYINAENGNEEDILMIINTPNGTLTM